MKHHNVECRTSLIATLLCLLAVVALPGIALAADGGATPFGPPTFHVGPTVITSHRGRFNGKRVDYTATVQSFDVADAKGGHGARIVAFSYLADAVAGKKVGAQKRPVLFLFNGGPIVASVFLHMGSFAPKRVFFPDDPAVPLKYELRDNPYSLLDSADLVFFDPASTGFSRVVPGKNPRDYHSVETDGQQTTAFIAAWLRRNGRLSSPKYILGESYGTNRAVEVGRRLAELKEPVLLNGMVLFGQAVNIAEYVQRPNNILSYVLSLPTLAATAWHFQKVDRGGLTVEQFIAKAREFARDQYLPALYRGNSLSPDETTRVAQGLESLSGIPASYYIDNRLRISKETYRAELLRDQKLLLGRTDSRYTAPLTDKGIGPDPAFVLGQAHIDVFRGYLIDSLAVDWDEPYVIAAGASDLDDWGWGAKSPFAHWQYVDSVAFLMKKNPEFRVMLATGYYDTQTTIGAAEYAATQSGWPADRTWVREYPGGHMAYSIDATAQKFGDDLRELMKQ